MKRLLVLLALLASPAAARGQAPTPEHLAAARQLLEVMDSEEVFFRTMALTMESAAFPGMAGLDVQRIQRVVMELVRWEAMEPGMAALYARLYTLEELREMTVFYRTPLGRRMVATAPELTVGAQAVATEVMLEIAPELARRIGELAEEPEDEDGKPPGRSRPRDR